MRIIKLLFGCFLILLFPIFFLQASAEKEYLEAKNYITSASSDATQEISSFLQTCKNKRKDAFFNKGIYKINGIVNLQDGVSLFGEEGTIIQGIDEENQSYLKDSVKVVSITIENIIFDNVTINFSHTNSDKITIQNNVFLNAKFADIDIGGIKPDSSNKNGGKSTGYYISKSYNQISILSNLFLRDKNSLGRGVSIYKTKNALIQDNYFGILEDVENSIVSEQTKALKRRVLDSGLTDSTSNQGYFMTAINVINSDENAQIIGNHISVNKDITEAGYEDGSQSTFGYNRDHLIYAKMYKGLAIVGNYFKGMNKNQDGGVKCRNGEDLLIYRNVFEDSLVLLYVQNANTNQWLKNVCVKENIFLNKDYTNELIQIPSGTNVLKKYITIDYSILLKNYMESAEVNNITIDSNIMYSAGLPNEQIRIDNTQFAMPTNVTIQNNANILGRQMRLTILNTLGSQNYDSNQQGNSPNYTNGTTYIPEISDVYQAISVEKLAEKNEVDYEIQNGCILSSANQIYVDSKVYQNEEIQEGMTYQIFLIKTNSTTEICVEGVVKTIPTNLYTIARITKNQTYRINFQLQGHGQAIDEISASCLPETFPNLEAVGYTFDGWYMDLGYTQPAVPGERITQDTTLYAKWIQNRYTITYVTEYGEQPDSITEAVQLPAVFPTLTADGYEFEGWYLEAECITKPTKGATITSDVTLYAKWIEQCEVIFQNDQHLKSVIVRKGDTIKDPPTPEKSGYNFDGWYTDSACTKAFDFEQPVTHSMNLYAKWTQVFTVAYDVQGHGTAPASVQNVLSLPTKLPEVTAEGFVFDGWYLEAECITKATEGTTITSNITLYAKWTLCTYMVTYSMQGHGSAIASVKDLSYLPNPLPIAEETGWEFQGWYLDETYKEKAIEGQALTKDITLYAKWEIIPKYTVTFQVVAEGMLAQISLLKGKKISRPTEPIKEEYKFDGWYTDSDCTKQWDFDTTIKEDVILYAKWISTKEPEEKSKLQNNLWIILSVAGVGILGLGIIGVVILKKKKK